MPIYYDYESEAWRDTENEAFDIPMTPEGDPEDLNQKFDCEESFYKFYYRSENK